MFGFVDFRMLLSVMQYVLRPYNVGAVTDLGSHQAFS